MKEDSWLQLITYVQYILDACHKSDADKHRWIIFTKKSLWPVCNALHQRIDNNWNHCGKSKQHSATHTQNNYKADLYF